MAETGLRNDSDLVRDLEARLQQDVGELGVRFSSHPQSEVWVRLYGVDHLYTDILLCVVTHKQGGGKRGKVIHSLKSG